MGKIANKKADIKSAALEYGQEASVRISGTDVVVDLRVQSDRDLNQIKGAVQGEIKDKLGYDFDVNITVNAKKR